MFKKTIVLYVSLLITYYSFGQVGIKDTVIDKISQYNKDLKNNWEKYLEEGGDWQTIYENKEYSFNCRNILILEYLVSLEKLNIDTEIDSNYTPFSHGCLCGSRYLVQKGLNNGIAINRLYRNSMTALMLTIKSGNLDNFKLVANKKPDISPVNNDGYNAITLAAEYSKEVDFIDLLLSLGSNINSINDKINYNTIELAYWKGEETVFKYLLDYCLAKKDTFYIKNSNLLERSILSGDTLYIKKLIPIYKPTKFDWENERFINAISGFVEVYNLLNRYRDNPSDTTSSLYNTENLDIKTINILLDYGYDINNTSSLKQNLLIKCRENHQVVDLLITKGIKINAVDSFGKTFLQYYIDEIVTPPTIRINGVDEPIKPSNRNYTEELKRLAYYISKGGLVGNDKKNGWLYIYEVSEKNKNQFLIRFLKKNPVGR